MVVFDWDARQLVEFPFNWFPQRVGTCHRPTIAGFEAWGFHSIGFPSEWGPTSVAIAAG